MKNEIKNEAFSIIAEILKVNTKTLNILCEYYLTNSSLSKKMLIKYGKKLF